MPDFTASPPSSAMHTPTTRLEPDIPGLINSMLPTLLGLSFLSTRQSCIKPHLAIALKKKSGDQSNGASWLNILNGKGSLLMPITRNIWLTLPPMDNLMEVVSLAHEDGNYLKNLNLKLQISTFKLFHDFFYLVDSVRHRNLWLTFA